MFRASFLHSLRWLFATAAWLGLGVVWTNAAYGDPARRQELFEQVFGDAVRLDPAMVEKIKALPPGERLFVDTNGDGKKDEVWFIDTAARHTAEARPILVRAIDEDGDMDLDGRADLDSDLYVADYHADGTVDVILDYQDNDGDNDLDEMAYYFYQAEHSFFGKDILRVWWLRDDGDDNLLGYDVNYTYYQNLCQYRCHWGGDETLVAFGLKAGEKEWASAWENPFLFYDPDGDWCSEVVLRIEGRGDQIRALRYSFDADNDADERHAHDYDFSITAITEENTPLLLPTGPGGVERTTLRGLPTQAWLGRGHAQEFVTKAPWYRALLTWDEMNANTDGNVENDPNERWEGIIAQGNEDFKRVGGPACSKLNKRNELSVKPSLPLTLYYDRTDRRLHLKGANRGWLDVDFDYDGKVDMKYAYRDDDQDGIFDRRQLDLDADGQPDFDWPMQGKGVREIPLEFEAITAFWPRVLQETLTDSQRFIDVAKAALADKLSGPDPVETFFLTKLESWMPATHLGARMRKTPAGARYYVDLLRDRLLWRLRQHHGKHAAWDRLEKLYAAGDYSAAAEIMEKELVREPARPVVAFKDFSKRVAIRLDNTGCGPRRDWPITVRVADLKKNVADFNPDNCAVVAPQRWIDWREIPHQVDTVDAEIGPELSFLVDLGANEKTAYYVYYSPTGRRDMDFVRKTGTAADWVPPNIGWESNRAAYRAYYGQFDFFGKKTDDLILDNIGAKSYHDETEWGIDALHSYATSGIGGVTLYQEDQPYRVQNPVGKGQVQIKKRIVTQGPVRCAIELEASNIIPAEPALSVRLQCLLYAERQESEVRVWITGSDDNLQVAPGLIKLASGTAFFDPRRGCLGVWGFQEYRIDEIGMGLIVPPAALTDLRELRTERRLLCRADEGRLRYWIIGDWRRGRQYPVAPTIDNWRRELTALAGLLNNEVKVAIDSPESVR